MGDPFFLATVCVCALAGTAVGFLTGLVPGLHMNNIAALLSAYAASTLSAFGSLSTALGSASPRVSIASFLVAALTAHTFAESVPSTYVGIPAGDVVSVLPAHRLAKAGLGRAAVRAAADGVLSGVLVSAVLLVPACFLMGGPIGIYEVLRDFMGLIVILVSCLLIASEGSRAVSGRSRSRLLGLARGAILFAASGLLGCVVLKSRFYCCPVPDLPWMPGGFTPRESLLLPMFAGLFGVPSLVLSLGSRQVFDLSAASHCVHLHRPSAKDLLLSLFGGTVVGWMPGMTSGAAATLCAPSMRETVCQSDIPASLRFIWLYSSISGSGAVFSLGALFAIMRARSGTMDAAEMFLDGRIDGSVWSSNLPFLLPLVLAMILAALVAHSLLRLLESRIRTVRDVMGSRTAALSALAFVVTLSIALTGTRGAVVLVTSAMLGLIPPLVGVRRIQLMGCLLVPIAVSLLGSA